MNAAEEMVVGAARQAAERGDATAIEASLLIVIDNQQAAIQRVRALHGRHDPNCPYGEDCAGAGLCLACREEYPCATIRALDGSNSPPVTSEITGPLIDPDCRDGKHSSCVGGPCECVCHES